MRLIFQQFTPLFLRFQKNIQSLELITAHKLNNNIDSICNNIKDTENAIKTIIQSKSKRCSRRR